MRFPYKPILIIKTRHKKRIKL